MKHLVSGGVRVPAPIGAACPPKGVFEGHTWRRGVWATDGEILRLSSLGGTWG